ncbi:hypothetical protein KFL_007780085 [Klebsormidium nitens]|uniref:EsV-1-7 n=1 Tax=Klebsormidium nitens TaxID=105231 RepID=A0A1Y1IQ89_KLENI|nr:hypothetical protein KFL_007780085 [Klebsormidium nitens]|eukprot:GAQ91401.1 hypothetical protein KFL_007780085 [Klebsormidium nitens]
MGRGKAGYHVASEMARNPRPRRLCETVGCKKQPTYGERGNKKATRCSTHKAIDMINFKATRCVVEGCGKSANFGFEGKARRRCSKHQEAGMTCLSAARCTFKGCPTAASYGFAGKKKCRCTKHKEEKMILFGAKRCGVDGCSTQPKFGRAGEKPTRCSRHKDDDMVDLGARKCEERALREELKQLLPEFELDFNKRIDGETCHAIRPDVFVDLLTHVIVIENDENQHKGGFRVRTHARTSGT